MFVDDDNFNSMIVHNGWSLHRAAQELGKALQLPADRKVQWVSFDWHSQQFRSLSRLKPRLSVGQAA